MHSLVKIGWAAALAIALLAVTTPAPAQLDKLLKGLSGQGSGLSDAKIADGLKEALQVATGKTVSLTGKTDGYFGNQAIKILMPEKLKTLETGLRTVGYGPQVDEFVLSMNRAAESAAPRAKQIFLDAIGKMSFDDARKILNGGDTAATEFFRSKTTPQLTTAFRPVVSKSMNAANTRTWSRASTRSRSPARRPSTWTATWWTRASAASSTSSGIRRRTSAPIRRRARPTS